MPKIKDITLPFNIKKNDESLKETSIEEQKLIAGISQEEQIVSINSQPIKKSQITDHLEKKGYKPFFIFKVNPKEKSKTVPWSEVEESDPLLLYKKLFSKTKDITFNKGQNLIQNASCFLAAEKTLSFLAEEDPIEESINPKTPHPKLPPGKLNNFFTGLENDGHCTEDINKIKSILQNKKFLFEEEREENPMILYKNLLKKFIELDPKTRNQEEKNKIRCIEQTLDTLRAKLSFKR